MKTYTGKVVGYALVTLLLVAMIFAVACSPKESGNTEQTKVEDSEKSKEDVVEKNEQESQIQESQDIKEEIAVEQQETTDTSVLFDKTEQGSQEETGVDSGITDIDTGEIEDESDEMGDIDCEEDLTSEDTPEYDGINWKPPV